MGLLNFFHKKKEDLGNPLYNLRISLNLNKVCFEINDGDINPLLFLHNLAEISDFSRVNIAGYHLVTSKGLLLPFEVTQEDDKYRDAISSYPFFDATLTINDNEIGMNRLTHAFRNRTPYTETEELKVNLHYRNGLVQPVCTREGRIYLPVDKFNPLKNLEKKLVTA